MKANAPEKIYLLHDDRYVDDFEDQEFDYRKPMPKKEKWRRKRLHRWEVLRNKKKGE